MVSASRFCPRSASRSKWVVSQTRRGQPRDIGRRRARGQRHRGAETDRPNLEDCGRGDGLLYVLGHPLRLTNAIVGCKAVAGRATDCVQQARTVRVEAATNLAHHPVGMGCHPPVDVVDDVLPVSELRVHKPVDQ